MSGSEPLRPRDANDAAEIVRGQAGPFEIVAGGSKRAIGCPVDGAVLDIGALSGILAYAPEELVLTAHAATPLAVIEAELRAHGQRLAFEPPDYGALLSTRAAPTLGGVLAANAAGSRRVFAGAARDHFLGCRAVDGRGVQFAAGGKVVKNVTGYDLPKLFAGSWGTLAVLTEVTVRVAPQPETELTLAVPSSDIASAADLMRRALAAPLEVSSAAYDPRGHGCLLRLEGFTVSVAARAASLRELVGGAAHRTLDADASRSAWRDLGCAAAFAEWPVVWRICVPPAQVEAVVDRLAPERYVLDWGGALIWAAYAKCDVSRVRGALKEGHATLFKAPLDARRGAPVFQPRAKAQVALEQRLKAAFDPSGKLNPGRMG